MEPQTQALHLAIVPSPGMGHLIPLLEFSKRLVQLFHNFTVTFVIPTNGPLSNAQKSVLNSLPNTINYVVLPPVNLDDISDDADIETVISLTVVRSRSSLQGVFKSLVSRQKFVGLVVDLFGTDAFDVAKEFNISPYIFFPSTAMALSLFLYLPKLDQMVNCEYRELSKPVKIPGCLPIHGKELLDPVQDRQNDAYKWVLHHAKRYRLAEGIMVNSFKELEIGAITALQENEIGDNNYKPSVYPIGPLVNMEPSSKLFEEDSNCKKWLDEQPNGSVLYVSFGSGGTLSSAQITELAWGLEMSEQRFLWVVRSPNDKVANATFFNLNTKNDYPFDFLPKGFVERTKGRGLVVQKWAPQAQILNHGSTGGFLTHCGWNSTLESVVNGVPLVAWPLYAEQKMNAFMLTQDIKVALSPKGSEENGIMGREEIANVVRALMEGEDGKNIRNRMKDLKDHASRALSENGSSTKALSQLVSKWQKQN